MTEGKLRDDRPTWECGCPCDHYETSDRAWCADCSEWCYPHAVCLRGREALYVAALRFYADPVNHMWTSSIDAEGGRYTRASSIVDDDKGKRARDVLVRTGEENP